MKVGDKKRKLRDGLARKSKLAVSPLFRIRYYQFVKRVFPIKTMSPSEVGFEFVHI